MNFIDFPILAIFFNLKHIDVILEQSLNTISINPIKKNGSQTPLSVFFSGGRGGGPVT